MLGGISGGGSIVLWSVLRMGGFLRGAVGKGGGGGGRGGGMGFVRVGSGGIRGVDEILLRAWGRVCLCGVSFWGMNFWRDCGGGGGG